MSTVSFISFQDVGLIYRISLDRKTLCRILSVICDRTDRSLNIVVAGKVQRIIPDNSLTSKLKNALPRERAALYVASGIWYDSQTILAELLRKRPNDAALKADWQSLLESVRLGEIAQEPLVGELKVNKN